MILGIGTDIVSIARIEELHRRYRNRFARKILSDGEIAILPDRRAAEFIAGRFAAKEALVKALGGTNGLGFADLEFRNDQTGRPQLVRGGKTESILPEDRGAVRVHASISHEREFAVALVIVEAG